jgi:hypothetical protein
MTRQLSTKEAKAQALPGSDVFRYSHLLYHDSLNRDHGVVRLNIEALRAFGDTLLIARRTELCQEQRAASDWLAKGGLQSGLAYPWGALSIARMECINYEHLKIACGFELHLKARLLAQGFVIHEIDAKAPGLQDLAKSQWQRPISRAELFEATEYMFDGQANYLPALKQGSVRFSWLTEKPAYIAALGLPTSFVEVIDEFRQLRNQIHLPGDVMETPKISALQEPISSIITEFLNAEVICWSNSLIDAYQMHWPKLEQLR